ncbi:hypothetical protein KY285_030231 [Solanum tuberosum]|nr:hypothetical protein KY289_030362 [Solanum tuberosum]KAH0655349.1 hypothetical protein KY285_030231 [Solanum tuberosum]
MHMYQPLDSLDKTDNLDPESISEFFGNDLDWIREFNHDSRGVFWYKCPFTGHIPWDIDCDCPKCEDDYYGSEDDDEAYNYEYSYDREKWDEVEYQFLVSHKPQDWLALSTP